jgi:hypothetical protein
MADAGARVADASNSVLAASVRTRQAACAHKPRIFGKSRGGLCPYYWLYCNVAGRIPKIALSCYSAMSCDSSAMLPQSSSLA